MRVEQPLFQAICNQNSLEVKVEGKGVIVAGVLDRSSGMVMRVSALQQF